MGRPRLPKPKTSISITLFPETLKAIKKIGMGNVSMGVEVIFKKQSDLEDEAAFLRKTLEEEREKNKKLLEEKATILQRQMDDMLKKNEFITA